MYLDAITSSHADRGPTSGQTSHTAPTLHVFERDRIRRRHLVEQLESTGYPIDALTRADEFLADVGPETCGCILTELYLPDRTAVQLCEQVKQRDLALPIIIISDHNDPAIAVAAMRGGAFDFLLHPLSPTRLLDAVYQAIQHSQHLVAKMHLRRQLSVRYEQLTEREKQVFAMVVEGLPNKAIAYDLALSQRTVETHRNHVMHKMNARSLADLVRMAIALDPEAYDLLRGLTR